MPRNVPPRPAHVFTLGTPELDQTYRYDAPVQFADGRAWRTSADGVTVWFEALGDMTDAEIGQTIRALHAQAPFFQALDYAHWIALGGQGNDLQAFQSMAETEPLLRPFAGHHPLIDTALAFLDRGYHPPTRAPYTATPKPGYIYVLRSHDGYHKIGRTKHVPTRHAAIGTQLPFPVELVHAFAVSDMVWTERQLHERFAAERMHGTWFNLTREQVAWVTALTSFEQEGGAV